MCGLGGAEQHGEAAAVLGRELQPPQLGETDVARPCEHAAACGRAQRLLRRPQAVAILGGFDDEYAFQADAGSGERRRVGQVGRGDPGDTFALRGQPGQRRAEDAQLAYAFVLRQDFGERPAGPAAARQFRIQGGKAGGDPRAGGTRKFAAAPDAGMSVESGREAGHGISKSCMFIQYPEI